MMWCYILLPVHSEGSGDLGFCVLSAADQTDGCKLLSYLILLPISLVPKPMGLVTKSQNSWSAEA